MQHLVEAWQTWENDLTGDSNMASELASELGKTGDSLGKTWNILGAA